MDIIIPDEIWNHWQAGLDEGMNNKTARKAALDKWNEQNPDVPITPAMVGVTCSGQTVQDMQEMSKKQLSNWAFDTHGIIVPKGNKESMIAYIEDKLAEQVDGGPPPGEPITPAGVEEPSVEGPSLGEN